MRVKLSVVLLGFLLITFLADREVFNVECSDVHDIAIVDFVVFPGQGTTVYPRIPITANVTVENQGTTDESCNVTLYFGNVTIDNVNVTNLQAGSRTNVTFEWSTYPFRLGIWPAPWLYPRKPMHKNVTMKAEAHAVPGEIDTVDNVYIDGVIDAVWMVPDVNGDGKIDMRDIGAVARYFGGWDIYADFNSDGIVDMRDIGVSARVFGSHYG